MRLRPLGLLATLLLLLAGAPMGAGDASAAKSFDERVRVAEGIELAVTVYRPANATADAPVPVVLHSHGWSGSRVTDGSGLVGKLWHAGFGVVAIDARGHGGSDGAATVHHRDAEVKDLIALLDWVHDELPWVAREPGSGIAKDVVAGGAGYSYAGGMQLMTASYDGRLDAIAPEITWSDLPDSLAPQGVPKSLWLDFLYGTAKESGTRIDERIDLWYAEILAKNEVPPDALEHFRGSSPILSEIDADVLLIQGVPDTLFNLNQALRTHGALEARGEGDVRLFTHLTGHVAPFFQPFGTSFQRRDIFLDEGPCGVVSDLVVRWLDEKLRHGPASGIPEASYALDDGTCERFDAVPSGARVVAAGSAPLPNAAGTLFLPLMEGPALLAGVPHLRADVSPLATPARGFASLAILSPGGFSRIVDDQTQPFVVTPGGTIDVDMGGVAARMHDGDRLYLRLDGLNEWHAHNSGREPGLALLRDISVSLPVADEGA